MTDSDYICTLLTPSEIWLLSPAVPTHVPSRKCEHVLFPLWLNVNGCWNRLAAYVCVLTRFPQWFMPNNLITLDPVPIINLLTACFSTFSPLLLFYLSLSCIYTGGLLPICADILHILYVYLKRTFFSWEMLCEHTSERKMTKCEQCWL